MGDRGSAPSRRGPACASSGRRTRPAGRSPGAGRGRLRRAPGGVWRPIPPCDANATPVAPIRDCSRPAVRAWVKLWELGEHAGDRLDCALPGDLRDDLLAAELVARVVELH